MFPLSGWGEPRSSFPRPVEPPSVDPDEGGLISISFNPAWLPYVLGALSQLTQLTTWIGDDDAKRLAVERATGLMNLIGLPAATSVLGEPPAPTVTTRYNPTTHTVQTSTDGGTTWVDAPGSDPRFTSPLPAQTGTNADCNSAASERKYLTRFGSVLQLTGGTGVTATGLGYAILALLLDLSGPWAIIFEVVVAAALGFISAGLTAIDIAFSDGNLDILECDLFCALNGGTKLNADSFAAWQADITTHIGGTDATILNAVLSLQGFGGVNSAMALKLDTDDCSGCGCTWCYNFDFTVSDGGWHVLSGFQAAYIPGVGWQSQANGVSDVCEITRTFTSVGLTDVEFTYTTGHAANGGTRAVDLRNSGSSYHNLALNTGVGTFTTTYNPAHATDRIDVYVDTFNFHNKNTITAIKIKGTGTNPFGADNC